MLGLLLVRPFLAEKAVIIVGNSNVSAVQQAGFHHCLHSMSNTVRFTTPQTGYSFGMVSSFELGCHKRL